MDARAQPEIPPPTQSDDGSDETSARGEAWRAGHADARVAAELQAFGAAVERRFGDDGVRAMLRADGRAGAVTAPSVSPVAYSRCLISGQAAREAHKFHKWVSGLVGLSAKKVAA